MELGPGARNAMCGAPVSDRAEMLKELLDELRREQEENGTPNETQRSG